MGKKKKYYQNCNTIIIYQYYQYCNVVFIIPILLTLQYCNYIPTSYQAFVRGETSTIRTISSSTGIISKLDNTQESQPFLSITRLTACSKLDMLCGTTIAELFTKYWGAEETESCNKEEHCDGRSGNRDCRAITKYFAATLTQMIWS